jgi:hypothetical protein
MLFHAISSARTFAARALADPYFDYREDDRPQWERELDCHAGSGDPADEVGFESLETEDANGTEPTAPVVIKAVAVCENPNVCDGLVKAKDRCAPCSEYRRIHRGQERPSRLINRAKRRHAGA